MKPRLASAKLAGSDRSRPAAKASLAFAVTAVTSPPDAAGAAGPLPQAASSAVAQIIAGSETPRRAGKWREFMFSPPAVPWSAM
jgi:hypothetical protein